jgi:hypothetical protein
MRMLLAKGLVGLACLSFLVPARATVIDFSAILSGPNESPPTGSLGTGTASFVFDTVADTLSIVASFSGLTGTSTASHIHCCTSLPDSGTAMVATTVPTFAGFPLGVTSGTYSRSINLLDPTSYNAAFVTASGGTVASAEAALLAGMLAGEAYFNIHTTVNPGGEIRGFLAVAPAAAIPEPWTLALLATGILAGILGRRRLR